MLNTLTKTKTSLKSVSFQKNLGYGGSWKAQWTNALNRDSYLFFQIQLRYRLSRTNRPAIDGSQ
jgi:hypothetical protein